MLRLISATLCSSHNHTSDSYFLAHSSTGSASETNWPTFSINIKKHLAPSPSASLFAKTDEISTFPDHESARESKSNDFKLTVQLGGRPQKDREIYKPLYNTVVL